MVRRNKLKKEQEEEYTFRFHIVDERESGRYTDHSIQLYDIHTLSNFIQ